MHAQKKMLRQILPYLCFRSAYTFVEKAQAFDRTACRSNWRRNQSERLLDKACSRPTLQTQQAVICDV